MKKKSESKLNGIGFLLKIKKRKKDNNPINFFKRFIESALVDVKSHIIAKSVNNENIEEILIDEIQKKTGFEKKKKKEFRKSINEEKNQIYNYFANLPPRNIDTIIFCLRKLKKFNEFIKFNNISYEQLEKLAAYIKFQFVPKNHLLYSIGKKPKKFFCVINGCISVRTLDPIRIEEEKRIKNYDMLKEENSKNNSYENNLIKEKKEEKTDEENNNIKEFEIKKYTQGMCLCEWDLIRKRTFIDNAYAIENTNMFYLEKENFEKILSSYISRSDIERKYFIISKIPILSLDNLLNVQPEFYNKGDIIYTEFDKAIDAILIYKGSSALTQLNDAQNKKDIYERRKELKIITKVERGGLAGLEIGKINIEKRDIFYDNTLIITDDNTIIFRLNIDILKGKSKKLGRNLKQFFNDLYTQQNNFINNLKNNCLKAFKMNQEMSLEEKRMIALNKIFESLSKSKIELKESKLEKIKTHININHSITEKNYSKNNINNIKIKKKKRHINLKSLDIKLYSNSTDHSSKIFVSTEYNDNKHYNFDKIKSIKCNKLILKRNINHNIINTPTQSNNINNYNNYYKEVKLKKEFENSYSNHQDNQKKNFHFSNITSNFFKQNQFEKNKNLFNRNNNLKFKNNNKSIENESLNNNKIPTIKKYFYDSGKFKIPLISLDNQ